MIDIIEKCCSPYYLQMFIKMVPPLDKWQVEYEDYNKINLRKLNLIEGEKIKEDFLSGIAVGLLMQIYAAGGHKYFTPTIEFCGLSIKDKDTPVNMHFDPWPEDVVKILGLLNHDWNSNKDGGGFIIKENKYDLKPTNFLLFDSREEHSNAKILSDKKRVAIDFAVSKRKTKYWI